MSDVWRMHRELQVQRGYEEHCAGALMIVDRTDPLVTVECNACGYTACIPTHEFVPPVEREAAW